MDWSIRGPSINHLSSYSQTLIHGTLISAVAERDNRVSTTSLPELSQSQSSTALPHEDTGERGLRYGLRDGACQAVTQGSGEQYLSAFALLFQANAFHLSVLSALPQLIGTVAQIASVKLLRWFPDRKTLLAVGTYGQALAWIPIAVLPLLLPQWGPWLVIAGAAAYFACNQFTAPAWTSFITDRLDEHERGAYFARRARILASLSFVALCIAGGILSFWQGTTAAWWGFLLVFVLAGGARLLSALALAQVEDAHPTAHLEAQHGFRAFLQHKTTKDFRRFLLFSGLMIAAVLVAGPFFVLYTLQDLYWSYLQYGAWLAAGLLGQLLTLSGWGQFGDRFGNKALLSVTGFTVPVLPMLYLVSTNLAFLLSVNFLGGVIWAGLSLGLQNYVFDSVQPEDRSKAVAVSSTVNAVGWSLGALLGSWLADTLPRQIVLGSIALEPASNLPFVFFVSGCLRLIVSLSLLRSFCEARKVERLSRGRLFLELPLVKPLAQRLDGAMLRRTAE